jgi:cell division septation protein DedD
MAATVVSVVIFLCGVLVGRGVRIQRGAIAEAAAMNEAPAPDVVRAASTPPAAPEGTDPTAVAAPPSPVDDLSYPNRLDNNDQQPVEEFKPAAPRNNAPRAVAAARPASRPAPAVAKAVETPAAPQTAEKKTAPPVPVPIPSPAPTPAVGDGFAVQVAAVNVRDDADAIVKKLSSKGYSAYVQQPPNGTGSVFRVRVGTFKTRREAETVAARLQKEEQFTPWITR